jgi:hypothetical protein
MEPQAPQNQPAHAPDTPAPPKRKRGRPPILDETKRAQICAMLSLGCSMGTATRYVGVTVHAVRKAARRDPHFNEQLQKAVRAAEVSALRHLHNAAANNWRAAAWLLERTRPQQYGYRSARHLKMDFYHVMHEHMVNYLRELLPDDKSREWFDKRMELALAKERSNPIIHDLAFFGQLPRPYPTPLTFDDWPDDPPPSLEKHITDNNHEYEEEHSGPRVPLHSDSAALGEPTQMRQQMAANSSEIAQSDLRDPHFCVEIPPN